MEYLSGAAISTEGNSSFLTTIENEGLFTHFVIMSDTGNNTGGPTTRPVIVMCPQKSGIIVGTEDIYDSEDYPPLRVPPEFTPDSRPQKKVKKTPLQ
jgi:hypothetical protein